MRFCPFTNKFSIIIFISVDYLKSILSWFIFKEISNATVWNLCYQSYIRFRDYFWVWKEDSPMAADRLMAAISARLSRLKLLPKKWLSSNLLLLGVRGVPECGPRGVPMGGPRGVPMAWGVPTAWGVPAGCEVPMACGVLTACGVAASELLEILRLRTLGDADTKPFSSSSNSWARRVSVAKTKLWVSTFTERYMEKMCSLELSLFIDRAPAMHITSKLLFSHHLYPRSSSTIFIHHHCITTQ